MSAPSPFLRLEQLRAEDVSEGMIRDVLVEHLIGLSDEALTRLLAGYCPAQTNVYRPTSAPDLYHLAVTYDVSANWLAKAIKARVLDRWLEENS